MARHCGLLSPLSWNFHFGFSSRWQYTKEQRLGVAFHPHALKGVSGACLGEATPSAEPKARKFLERGIVFRSHFQHVSLSSATQGMFFDVIVITGFCFPRNCAKIR